jgi:hypothetical protein
MGRLLSWLAEKSHPGPDLQACFMSAGRFMGPDVPLT